MEKYILSLVVMALLVAGQVLGQNVRPEASTPVWLRNSKLHASPKKHKVKCCALRPKRLFRRGQFDLYFSAGVLPTYLLDKATVKLPPVLLGAGFRFSEAVSLSATGGHSLSQTQPHRISNDVEATWTNSLYQFSLKPGFHLTKLENWDFYGGFAAGLNLGFMDGTTNGSLVALRQTEQQLGIRSRKISPSFFGYLGVRHVVDAKWTVQVETGSALSLLNLGFGYRLMSRRG